MVIKNNKKCLMNGDIKPLFNNYNSKSNKFFIFLFFIFTFILLTNSINTAHALNDKSIIKDKIDKFKDIPRSDKISEKRPFLSGDRIYETETVKIKSHKDNYINLDKAIIKDKYISIGEYTKGNQEEDFEISIYTGNDNIKYQVIKSEEVNVNENYVKENGNKYAVVKSKDGYVNFKTKGFSTFVLAIPDFEVPFFNTVSLDLKEYSKDAHHYAVSFFDVGNTVSEYPFVIINEGFASLNTDTFEVNLYDVGGDKFLDLFVYDSLCSDEIVDNNNDCFYLGSDVIDLFNDITVYACDDGQNPYIEQLSETEFILHNDGCDTDTFNLNTYTTPYYYRTSVDGRTGLHENIIDYFSFNDNQHDNELTSRWGRTLTNNGATFTEINEFKAGGYEGGAFEFDSDGEAFIVDIDLSNYNALTFCSYIKSTTTIGINMFFSSTYSGLDDIRFQVNNNQIFASFDDGTVTDMDYSFTDTTQYHDVCVTHDGTDAKLYVDGILRDTVLNDNYDFSTHTGTSVYIGGRSNGLNNCNCLMDEVFLSDEALTATEISYRYNGGSGVNFYNLNTPQRSVNTNIPLTLQQGFNKIYLQNYFVFDQIDGTEYTFNYTTYDFTTENFVTIEDGFGFVDSELYNVSLSGDELTFYYFGSETQLGYDGIVRATNNNGDTEFFNLIVTLPVIAVDPPIQLIPLNAQYTTNFSINMNTHFQDYNKITLSYSDEIMGDNVTYATTLSALRSWDNVTSQIGNISVNLDNTQVANNIILDVFEVEDKLFNGVMYVNASNSAGYVEDFFTLISGTPPVDLVKEIIPNQTLYKDDIVVIKLDDYFYNVSYAVFQTTKNNITFTVETPEYPFFLNYTDANDTRMWVNGQKPNNQTNISYENRIEIHDLGIPVNTTEKYTVTVYDEIGNIGQQNFYIIVSDDIIMSQGAEIFNNLGEWVVNLFPTSESLTNAQSIGIVVIVLIIVTALIIGLSYKSLGNTSIYLSIGVDILLFLFFAGIGYISTGFLVLIALLLIGLSYLKMRG